MSAAGTASRSAGGSAGRLQTFIVIAVAAIVMGVAAYLIVGPGDGVTEVQLKPGAAANAPVLGAEPPAFSGTTWDGKAINLADYAGKPLWLTFGASWCPDCRNEAADVQAAYSSARPKGLQLVAIFINEPSADIQAYATRAGLTFPIIVDEGADIASVYRSMGIPTHYFIGADGKIKLVRIGALSREDMDQAIASILN